MAMDYSKLLLDQPRSWKEMILKSLAYGAVGAGGVCLLRFASDQMTEAKASRAKAIAELRKEYGEHFKDEDFSLSFGEDEIKIIANENISSLIKKAS